MEDYLVQHVTELFDDLITVSRLDCIEQLVGLFKQILG
ncbi:MAG: hypothetical protein RL529_1136, partial [Actinomycetota bacterium]